MNYLLDTCVLAEFKKKKPNPKVLKWLDNQIEPSFFLSVITIGEIQKGISALPTSKRKTGLENWLQSLIYRYDRRIISLNIDEIMTWGELNGTMAKKGFVFPFADSLIAATALTHRMTVVTQNESDFKNIAVKILNIWK